MVASNSAIEKAEEIIDALIATWPKKDLMTTPALKRRVHNFFVIRGQYVWFQGTFSEDGWSSICNGRLIAAGMQRRGSIWY